VSHFNFDDRAVIFDDLLVDFEGNNLVDLSVVQAHVSFIDGDSYGEEYGIVADAWAVYQFDASYEPSIEVAPPGLYDPSLSLSAQNDPQLDIDAEFDPQLDNDAVYDPRLDRTGAQ
jgi:hypothetical protein